MGIGIRIRQARECLGITQRELANKIGVTAQAVTNYENNTSHPKEPIMYKLLAALQVDANFLFQDEMEDQIKKEPTTPAIASAEDSRLQNIIERYNEMNEDGQESLNQLAIMHAENPRYKKATMVAKHKKAPSDLDVLWESAGKTVFGGAAAFGGSSEQIEYTPEEYKRICELYDSISKK